VRWKRLVAVGCYGTAIAGTAVSAGIPLVTRDEHFRRVPADFRLFVRGY